jgi:MFS family permease
MRASVTPEQANPTEKSTQASGNPFAALRHRNFQLYFGGQLISNAGTWMQVIAQGWLVYQLTHSELALGIVSFAAAIPGLLVTPWGGVVVDSVPKRTLLILTQSGAMILAFILAALTFSGLVREWHIVALAAGLGLVNAFDSPGRQAFVFEMVGIEDLPNAIALNSLMFNSARVIGPAIAGLLLAVVGAAWCFTINGASYLAVIAGLYAMQIAPRQMKVSPESPWKQLISGIRYVSEEIELGGLLLLSLIFSAFGFAYLALLPAFVGQILGQGAIVYGWLIAFVGVGAVIGALIIANQHGKNWRGQWLWLSNLLFPLVLIAFVFNTFLPLSFLLMLGLGFGFMVVYTMINTLLQTHVEDRLRGRVMGLYTFTFLAFTPFGNLALGAISEKIGLSYAITYFALIDLILILLVFRKVPKIRSLP